MLKNHLIQMAELEKNKKKPDGTRRHEHHGRGDQRPKRLLPPVGHEEEVGQDGEAGTRMIRKPIDLLTPSTRLADEEIARKVAWYPKARVRVVFSRVHVPVFLVDVRPLVDGYARHGPVLVLPALRRIVREGFLKKPDDRPAPATG